MSQTNAVEFLSPVGRLVFGHPTKKITTNFDGSPIVVKSGPNKGQPGYKFQVGLAIAKTDPDLGPFWAKIAGVAKGGFPHLFDAAGNCTHPQFSFKMQDGDGRDMNGKNNAEKEGYAGCYVFTFGTSYLVRVFRHGRYAAQDQLTEEQIAAEIRRGYYYRAGGLISSNDNATKPGVYLNLSMLALWGHGQEIVSGPDAATVFGQASAVLPVGAVALPAMAAVAAAVPGLGMMPGMQVAPAVVQVAPVAAMPGMQVAPAGFAMPGMQVAPAAATIAVQPNPAFAGGVAVPGMALPAGPAGPGAPLAPARQMTAAAGTYTYEQHIASGWTDDTLRAAGKMV